MKPGDRLIDIVRWNRPWLMGLRVFLIAATTPLSVIAFRNLPFAEAFALLFLMPSLVTILSIFILKEHVRWRRGLAVCAAFIGVLIIVRPGFKELSARPHRRPGRRPLRGRRRDHRPDDRPVRKALHPDRNRLPRRPRSSPES